MSTRVRSYSKINLGLAIGPPRADGFHALSTLYQTVALHDFVTVSARPADATSITLTSNDTRVPTDARNTAWKMVERALTAASMTAAVEIHIDKRLPVQGGMGAGSANAAAALLGLERELSLVLAPERRLAIAAEVGSDVPLFLIGGSVLGSDRGQIVQPVADVTLGGRTEIPCVIALPAIGVSTPLAFREWDRRFLAASGSPGLHSPPVHDTLSELSRTYASVLSRPEGQSETSPREFLSGEPRTGLYGASGILPDPSPHEAAPQSISRSASGNPENLQGLTREQPHTGFAADQPSQPAMSGFEKQPAEDSLLALVRTGIENDFEQVVFAQHPSLGEIKRLLSGESADGVRSDEGRAGEAPQTAGSSALYAALSGSGAALFGLYRSAADADAAQYRLQQHGVQAIVTSTLARSLYWSSMFAG